MAGPAVTGPARTMVRPFTQTTPDDLQAVLGIMSILHSQPLSTAFNRLLSGKVEGDDAISLAHFFEEVAVLTGHRRVAEDLVFDMLALDLYWEQLKSAVERVRKAGGNSKFGENFELVAQTARQYREEKPSKLS